MKKHLIQFAFIAMTALFALVAFAQQTSPSIIASETAENFYVAERDILVRSTVGNIYAASNSLRVSDRVIGDITYAGRSMWVEGEVDGDLRIAAEKLSVNDLVYGDVVFFGAEAEIGADGEVGGDLVIAIGRSVTIRGTIDGDVRLSLLGPGSSLDIFGDIRGDLSIANLGGGKITAHDGSVIEGDIIHTGEKADSLVINNGAIVEGQTSFIASQYEAYSSSIIKDFIAFLIIALIGFLLFRKYASQLSYSGPVSAIVAVLIGIGFLALALVAGVVFTVLLQFSWIGFFFFVACVAALCIGILLVPLLLGNILWRLARQGDKVNLINTLIGGIAAAILYFVPFLSVVLFIIALYAIGAIVRNALTR